MAYDQKKYIDLTGLTEFLAKIQQGLANNTAVYNEDPEHPGEYTIPSKFLVLNSVKALKDSLGRQIDTTYLTTSAASEGYVPRSFTIGDYTSDPDKEGIDWVDFGAPISTAQLRSVLKVSAGGESNLLEGVQVKGRNDADFQDLVIDQYKKVQIDLSTFATVTEVQQAVTSVFRFQGIKDTVAALEAVQNPVQGDVWHVTATDGEYVWIDSGDYVRTTDTYAVDGTTYYSKSGNTYTEVTGLTPGVSEVWGYYIYEGGHWELISHNLSEYYTKNEVYTKSQVDEKDATLKTQIDSIYKAAVPAQGEPGDPDYTPAVPASGTLVTEITRVEGKADTNTAAIATLNGNASTAGSVAKSISDALAGLTVTDSGTGYVTAVTQTNGTIAVTKSAYGVIANGDLTAPTAAGVQSYVSEQIASSKPTVSDIGATGQFIQVVGQTNGSLHATAVNLDTTIGPASGTGAATNNVAPGTLAVRTELDAVYAAYSTALTNAEIDTLFVTT